MYLNTDVCSAQESGSGQTRAAREHFTGAGKYLRQIKVVGNWRLSPGQSSVVTERPRSSGPRKAVLRDGLTPENVCIIIIYTFSHLGNFGPTRRRKQKNLIIENLQFVTSTYYRLRRSAAAADGQDSSHLTNSHHMPPTQGVREPFVAVYFCIYG